MKRFIYKILGYYNIVMGTLLTLSVLTTVAALLYRAYQQRLQGADLMHLGVSLVASLMIFILCLLGIRTGILLNRSQASAIRAGFVVMVPQILAITTSQFTFFFHYGLFFDVGFLKQFHGPLVWHHWWSWQSRGGLLIGPPTINGVIAPIQLALYVNFTAIVCCAALLYLWLQERKGPVSSTALSTT